VTNIVLQGEADRMILHTTTWVLPSLSYGGKGVQYPDVALPRKIGPLVQTATFRREDNVFNKNVRHKMCSSDRG
jgi:hypothetical protein